MKNLIIYLTKKLETIQEEEEIITETLLNYIKDNEEYLISFEKGVDRKFNNRELIVRIMKEIIKNKFNIKGANKMKNMGE